MDCPPERRSLKVDGFDIPIITFRASETTEPRPVLIIGNGLDGSMEEMLHFHGFNALERGYHVVLYEGPGQVSVRRQQKKGFIHDWEKVVTPVVDYLETMDFVDKKRIGLLGNSLGGYLGGRAAAFEHRLAAVILIDGVYDVYTGIRDMIPPKVAELEKLGYETAFNTSLLKSMASSTNLRWIMGQIQWSFMANPYQALQLMKSMTLADVVDNIQCPVFVGDAEHDLFVVDQPRLLAEALGPKATWVRFTKEHSAEAHCHVGATVYVNQIILEWFKDVIA